MQKGFFVFSSLKLLQKWLYKTSTAAAVCSSDTDTIQLLADQTNKKKKKRKKEQEVVPSDLDRPGE